MYMGTHYLADILTIFLYFEQLEMAMIADVKKAFH